MTKDELNEIRARADAAKPGPWTIRAYAYSHQIRYFCNSQAVPVSETAKSSRFYHGHGGIVFAVESPNMTGGDSFKQAERDFVAHARTDIPKLLDEVERLQTELQEAESESIRISYYG